MVPTPLGRFRNQRHTGISKGRTNPGERVVALGLQHTSPENTPPALDAAPGTIQNMPGLAGGHLSEVKAHVKFGFGG